MEDDRTSDLEIACRNFVKFKDALDQSLEIEWSAASIERVARRIAGITTPSISDYARPAIHPGDFVRMALPFSDPGYDYVTMQQVDVDPTLVVSGTYHRYDPIHGQINPNGVMDNSDALVTDNDKGHPELLRLSKIGSLPLYIASEGKNRVELFKKFRNSMKAMVTDTDFPKPENLRICRVRPWGIYSLSYQNKTQVLPFWDVTVPLLRAYGVTEGESYFDFFAIRAWRNLRLRVTGRLMM